MATRRRVPVPPPRPKGTSTAAPTAATATQIPRKSSSGGQNTQTMTGGGNNTGSSSGSSSTKSIRKPPVASRPLGNYYNSMSSGESANSNAGATAASPYAPSSVPTPAAPTTAGTDDDNDASWDDWGSEAMEATTTATNTTATSTATASSNTTGWYSAGSSSGSTEAIAPGTASGGGGAAPGIYGAGTTAASVSTAPGYPSFATPSNLSGAMDSSAPTMSSTSNLYDGQSSANNDGSATSTMPSFSIFEPSAQQQEGATGLMSSSTSETFMSGMMSTISTEDDEAPLLEELGINVDHIVFKSKAVVSPFSRLGGDKFDPAAICRDADLPGPLFFAMLLGFEMALSGKLNFGFIYFYGVCGCAMMTMLVNLMSPSDAVSIWTVSSVMGYALLPVNALAFLKIIVINLIHLQTLGNVLSSITVLWSTVASTRLLEIGCGMRSQRYLLAYPLLLYYSAFVMMTIF